MSTQKNPRKSFLATLPEKLWFRWLTVIATVLTVLGFFLSIPPVQEIVFRKRTSLTIESYSEIPVFDVRQPLEGLQIEYKGQDLIALKQNIIATRILIRNTGAVSITPTRVTSADPIGVRIIGGDIIQVTKTEMSTPHLRQFSNPIFNNDTITINPSVIIDPEDFISFDVIILKRSDTPTTYRALGKVEGLPEIAIRETKDSTDDGGLLYHTFSGDILVQLIRLPSYFLGFMIIFLVTGSTIVFLSGIGERMRRKKRKRLANSIWPMLEGADIKRIAAGLCYEALGRKKLQRISEILSDPEAANLWVELRLHPEPRVALSRIGNKDDHEFIKSYFDSEHLSIASTLQGLKEINLISVEKKYVDNEFADIVERFLHLLQRHETSGAEVQKIDPRGGDSDEPDTFRQVSAIQRSSENVIDAGEATELPRDGSPDTTGKPAG